jgi:hypothetical protein
MDNVSIPELNLSSLAMQLKPPPVKLPKWPAWGSAVAIILAVMVGLSPRFVAEPDWRNWAFGISFVPFQGGGITLCLSGLVLMSKPLVNPARELIEQIDAYIIAEEKLASRLVSTEPHMECELASSWKWLIPREIY